MPDPQVQSQNDLRRLHGVASQVFNVGDFDTFRSKISDPARRRKFYDSIQATGKVNLGTYDLFSNKVDAGLADGQPQITGKPGRIASVEDLLAGKNRPEVVEADKHNIPPSPEIASRLPQVAVPAAKPEVDLAKLLSIAPGLAKFLPSPLTTPVAHGLGKLGELMQKPAPTDEEISKLGFLEKAERSALGSTAGMAGQASSYLLDKLGQEGAGQYAREQTEKALAATRTKTTAQANKKFDIADIGTADFWATDAAATVPPLLALLPLGMAGATLSGPAAAALVAKAGITGGLASTLTGALSSIGGALASRPVESLMEASSTYEDLLKQGAPKEKAAEAAAQTFRANLSLVGLDAAQLASIMFGNKAPKGVVSGFSKFANKALTAGKIGAGALSEGLEEKFQSWVSDVTKDFALGKTKDYDFSPQEFYNYINQAPLWQQEDFVLGTLMGLGAEGVGVLREMGQSEGEIREAIKRNPQAAVSAAQQATANAASGKPIMPAKKSPVTISLADEPEVESPAVESAAPAVNDEQKETVAKSVFGKSFAELSQPQKNLISKKIAEAAAKDEDARVSAAVKNLFAPQEEKKAEKVASQTKKQPESALEATAAPQEVIPAVAAADKIEKTAPPSTPTTQPESDTSPAQQAAPAEVAPKPPEEQPAATSQAEPAIPKEKKPTPDRTLQIGRGMNGNVRVIFPDKAHADLYALIGRFRRRVHSGKNSPKGLTAGVEDADRLAKKFGVTREEIFKKSDEYREQIRGNIKGLQQGDDYTAPSVSFDKSAAEAPTPPIERTSPPAPAPEQPKSEIASPSVSSEATQAEKQVAAEVKNVPLSQLHVDPDRFQNRATPFSEKTAATIAERFDPNKLDALTVWHDPQDNKDYVISGHSRFEGLSRIKKPTAPIKYFQGDEQAAINFAKLEANRLGTPESLSESIKAYRTAKAQNLSRAKLKDLFDGDLDFLDAAQNLDQKGDFVNILNQPAAAEFPYVKRFSRWVGELRGKYANKLTDRHEQQIFDWLYKGEKKNVDTGKDAFFKKVETQVERLDFSSEQPLVMKRGDVAQTGTRGRADTQKLVAQVDDLKKRRDIANTVAEKEVLQKEIDKLNAGIAGIVKTQPDLFSAAEEKPVAPAQPESEPVVTSAPAKTESPESQPTAKNYDRAVEIFNRVIDLSINKPTEAQQEAVREELEAAGVHPIIIRELTEPKRSPRPEEADFPEEIGIGDAYDFLRKVESKQYATTRKGRIESAIDPPAELKLKVDAIADAGKAMVDAEASLEQAKKDIIGEIEKRGGTVVVNTDTGAFTITLNTGRAKMGLQDILALKKLRQEAAEAGAYSLATVGRGFEIAVTPEKVAEAKPLAGTFAEKARELIRRNQAEKEAGKVLDAAKRDARNDLVDHYLAERAAEREPRAFKGTASDGTAAQVLIRRNRSAVEPDLAVETKEGRRDFPAEIKAFKANAIAQSGERGNDFISTRETKKKTFAEALKAGRVVDTASRAFGESNTLVTKKEFEKSLKNLQDKFSQLNVGIDPSMFFDLLKVGTYYVQGGAIEFKAWSAKMIEKLGDKVEPYLQTVWNEIKKRRPGLFKAAKAEVAGQAGLFGEPEAVATKEVIPKKHPSEMSRVELRDALKELENVPGGRTSKEADELLDYLDKAIEKEVADSRVTEELEQQKKKSELVDNLRKDKNYSEIAWEISSIAISNPRGINSDRAINALKGLDTNVASLVLKDMDASGAIHLYRGYNDVLLMKPAKGMTQEKILSSISVKFPYQARIASKQDRIDSYYEVRQTKHRAYIYDAIAGGKPVPANVLADYPDLAKLAKSDAVATTKPEPTKNILQEAAQKAAANKPAKNIFVKEPPGGFTEADRVPDKYRKQADSPVEKLTPKDESQVLRGVDEEDLAKIDRVLSKGFPSRDAAQLSMKHTWPESEWESLNIVEYADPRGYDAYAIVKKKKTDRDKIIDEIVEAAREKSLPNVVPVYELKGTDGKWHDPNGFRFGVESTGEERLVGYAMTEASGTQIGRTESTPEAVRERVRKYYQRQSDEFRQALLSMSDEKLNEQAEYWLKRKIFKQAKTEEPKPVPSPNILQQAAKAATESNKLSSDIVATKFGGTLPDGRKLVAKNIATRNGAQQGYVKDNANREIVEYKEANGAQRFAVVEKEQSAQSSVKEAGKPVEVKNVRSSEQSISPAESIRENAASEPKGESAKAVRGTTAERKTEAGSATDGRERERNAGNRQAEPSPVNVSEATRQGRERSGQAGADISATGESGARSGARNADVSERGATAKSRRESRGVSYEGDFRITDAAGLGKGGKRQKFNDNIAAIRLLKQLEAEGRAATPAEQSILVKYVGWGGLAQEAFGYTSSANSYRAERSQLEELLTDDEQAAARASTPNAHYTSPPVVRAIYSALQRFGFRGGKVIEPGSGIGNFVGLLPDALYGKTRFTAIEMDEISGRILKKLYPSADLRLEPFQNTKMPNNFYDAMTGNVPFGNVNLFDPEINKKFHQKFSIHNFFIIKALEKLRPGGVMGFITSRYTMDSQAQDFRKLVGQQADFIGAIRLPKETFGENAQTEVVTDILFFKKRGEGEAVGGEKWTKTKPIKGVDGDAIEVNEYYAKHPEMMIGDASVEGSMHRANEPTWSLENAEAVLPQEIAKRVEKLPEGIYSSGDIDKKLKKGDLVEYDELFKGAIHKRTGKVISLNSADGKKIVSLSVTDGRIDLPIEKVVKVYSAPIDAERMTGQESEREFVTTAEYIKQGGFEVIDGKIVIADGLTTTVSDESGVVKRMPKVRVLTDLPKAQEDKIRGMIAIRGAIRDVYKTQLENASPAAQDKARANLGKEYDVFVKKHGFLNLRENRKAFESDPDAYIVLALENFNPDTKQATKTDIFSKSVVDPRKTVTKADTAADALAVSLSQKGVIDFDLMAGLTGKDEETLQNELDGLAYHVPGAGWVPADEYLSGNVRDKLENAREAAKVDPAFKANVEALEKVQPEPLDASQVIPRVGATWVPADAIAGFADYLSGGNNAWKATHLGALGRWEISEKSRYSTGRLDNTLMRSKWGTSRIGAIDLLRDALNLKTPTVYDSDGEGGRILNEQETSLAQQKLQEIKDEFVDWAYKEPERRKSLVESYNRNFNNVRLRSFNGDHLTFDGASKNIKLRKHQRDAVWRILSGGNTLIGHVVGAGKTFTMIAAGMEARRMGIFKKPMYVVRKHMLEQFRKEFLQLYPNANILVADEENFHGSVRKQFMARIATGDWDAVIVTHPSLKFIPMSKETEMGLLKEQFDEMMSAEESLRETLGDSAKRDPSVKELEKARMRISEKLKELNDTKRDDAVTFEQLGVDMMFVDESQNFKNLFYATKMNRVLGLGSQQGGPVTFDMYMKTRYISKLNGGERGVVFSTGTPISNSMSEMYLLMKYLQPQTLQENGLNHFDSWASTFGDVVTAIERTSTGKFEPRSRFAKFVNIPELAKMFRRFADIRTADDLPELKDLVPKLKGGEVTPVLAQSSPELTDYMKALVRRAEELHGRPEKGGDNHLNIATDARKAGLDMRLIDPRISPSETPKVELAAENIYKLWRDTSDKKSTQIVFADMSAPAKDKFNVYDELKRLLVEKGIPVKDIAFIHDADTDAKKLELFNKINRGDVRVIVGSTPKLGEGTNVQRKLIAIHHLDAPWRPSDVEQRNGRIIRQGNENKEVYEYRYATERSFDTNMWQKLEQKARFISQVMTSDLTVREAEDITDAFASSAAEMKAITSGDPRIMELVQLENDIKKLEILRAGHRKQIFELQDNITWIPKQIESFERQADLYRKDIELTKSTDGDEEFRLSLGDKVYETRKDAGDAIIELYKKSSGLRQEELKGRYRGFEIEIIPNGNLSIRNAELYIANVSESSVGTIASIDNKIKSIPAQLENIVDRQKSLRQQLQTAKTEVKQPFKQEKELQSKVARKFQILGELAGEDKKREQGKGVTTREDELLQSTADELSKAEIEAADATVNKIEKCRS